jgi:hypothetical protein
LSTNKKGLRQENMTHQRSGQQKVMPLSAKANAVQTVAPGSLQMKKQPVAPPVYRPQPAPKCLQPKMAVSSPPAINQSKRLPVAPAAYRPQPLPKVLQMKRPAGQPAQTSPLDRKPIAPGGNHAQPQPGVLQRKQQSVPERSFSKQTESRPGAPALNRPQTAPNILQAKMSAARPANHHAPAAQGNTHLHNPSLRGVALVSTALPQLKVAVIQRAKRAKPEPETDLADKLEELIDKEFDEADSLDDWGGKGVVLDMKHEYLNVSTTHKEEINAEGLLYGCHTCKTSLTSDSDQPWIGDHIPPTELNASVLKEMGYNASPQRYLYPQCDDCAERQSELVCDLNADRKKFKGLTKYEKGLLKTTATYTGVASNGAKVNRDEGLKIQKLGVKHGCHSCDQTYPKDKYHADHCPPKEFYTHYMQEVMKIIGYKEITEWRAKPQCPRCSNGQGGAMKFLMTMAVEFARENGIVVYK